MPLPLTENQHWKPFHLFQGSTPNASDLECHVSVLRQGHRPHPPHTHDEEEILLLLEGEVDLLLPEAPGIPNDQRMRIRPGDFVYYPSRFPHTLEGASENPANYLMLKWQAASTPTEAVLSYGYCSIVDSLEAQAGKKGFSARRLFEGPTTWLKKLHCHTSTLTPGTGYATHSDPHDIVIIVLAGVVETLEEQVGPHSVIFYRAGEPHGMVNSGKDLAKYVVFEFHG